MLNIFYVFVSGLDDSALPSSSLELQRKMAELDQRIAMQKAEIDNMSQDIVSTAAGSTDIGTTALANIALPSNLQQILDSIKTIGAATSTDSQDSQVSFLHLRNLNIIMLLAEHCSKW